VARTKEQFPFLACDHIVQEIRCHESRKLPPLKPILTALRRKTCPKCLSLKTLTIEGFLASILPMVRGIQVKQHIVEGDYVATLFDMETAKVTTWGPGSKAAEIYSKKPVFGLVGVGNRSKTG
jgi:hypothetical protein